MIKDIEFKVNYDYATENINEDDIKLLLDFKENEKIYRLRKEIGLSYRRFRRMYIPKKSRRAIK